MDLLIDTQVLVWFALGSSRLPARIRTAIEDGANVNNVSAAIAFEFVELNRRGRFDADIPFAELIADLDATVLDLPSGAWRIAALLPQVHRDPVDQMLVAHALHADLTIVSADAKVQSYPVRTLW